MRIWTCKIGIIGDVDLPDGADSPMRMAVENRFKTLTGVNSDFNFSGWGDELTELEMAVVETKRTR